MKNVESNTFVDTYVYMYNFLPFLFLNKNVGREIEQKGI